nr:metallophosphoesterase [Escherichia coli]
MITVNDQALYSRIDGSGYRNIWVVGDLHGCYTLLMNELHRVDFDPTQDLLISVGDLIDRGAENVECLELLQMPWFRAVVGNHELLMLDALSPDGNVNNWLMNGGQWVQDAVEYLHMMSDAGIRIKGE